MAGRFVEIVTVIVKWRWRVYSCKKDDEALQGKYLRELFQELGSIFVKFGQMLSMRPDLLPRAYCHELLFLLDNVPNFSSDQVRAIILEDLGKPVESVFRKFDDTPIAAASLGQVHAAYTRRGEKVAVKILRPGVRDSIDRDIRLMKLLSRAADVVMFWNFNKLRPIVDEFEVLTIEELDYTLEAKHTKAFHKRSPLRNGICVPKVFEKYSSRRVLTLEFVEGRSLNNILRTVKQEGRDCLAIRELGCSCDSVARDILQNALKHIYLDGYFHADAHPGNFIFSSNKSLYAIDFGLVGTLSREERKRGLRYMRSFLFGDHEAALDALLELSMTPREKIKRYAAFREAHAEIVKDLAKTFQDAKQTDTAQVFGKELVLILQLVQKHRVVLLPSTLRYFRAILSVDSLVMELCPDMTLHEIANVFRNISILNLINDYSDSFDEADIRHRVGKLYDRIGLRFISFLEEEMLAY